MSKKRSRQYIAKLARQEEAERQYEAERQEES